jgi:two-component system, chemotaxis family, sensor kinase Cph1
LLGSCILLFLSIIGGLAFNSRQKSKNNILLASKNDEIADQNRQLADHIGVLKQYSYAAAHDLKEPLRTITSFINLLERKYIKTIDEPEAQEYMQFISSSAQRMNLLLTDLLEYNSILSQEVGFEAINTQDVLNDVWSGLSALVEDKQAVLQITNKLPKLKMNRFHMTQLMQNLVSNGIKFTERNHSLIQVGFERKENTYILSFSDNGIGINEQYQEKIFQMFYRLNDLKGAEGSGIGLTIVKNIIEKYKGRIWFNSEVGKGTTFFISLPIAMIIEDEQAATTQKATATLVQV